MHTHTRQHLQWLVLKRSNVFYFLCGKFTHCGSNPSRSPPDLSMTCVQGPFLLYLQGIKIHGKYNQAGRISGIGNDWVGISLSCADTKHYSGDICGTGSFLCGDRKCNRNKTTSSSPYLLLQAIINVWFSKGGQLQCWAVQFGKVVSVIVWEWCLRKMKVIYDRLCLFVFLSG